MLPLRREFLCMKLLNTGEVKGMSDFTNTDLQNEELEKILSEVRSSEGLPEAGDADGTPSKEWSLEDIDRLIAEESGESFEPSEPKTRSAAQKLEQMLSGSEYDEGMFTLKTDDFDLSAEEEIPEPTDIFSGGEVFGQEMFFEDDGIADDFDPSNFELETVVMPDAAPDPAEIKYSTHPEKREPLPPTVTQPVETKKEEAEKPGLDFRKKFFEKLRPEDIELPEDEEKEPEYPYDKSGIVVKKNESEEGEDLDGMPVVMAAEDAASRKFDEEKTKIVNLPSRPDKPEEKEGADVEGQIILTDFVDIPEEAVPEQSKEDDIEETLFEKRRQKAKGFKIDNLDEEFSDAFDEMNEDLPLADDVYQPEEQESAASTSLADTIGEYNDPSERSRIHTRLTERAQKAVRNVAIMGAVEGVLLIIALLTSLVKSGVIELTLFGQNSVIMYVVNALLIILAVFFDSTRFFDTFTQTVKGKITGNSATVVAVVIALIHNAIAAVTVDKGAYPVFGVIAVFGLLLNKITDMIDARRILDNFAVCAFTYDHNMYAVHPFENESEVFELGRGLLMGDAKMYYSSNLEFPTDFIKNSESEKDSDKYTKIMLIVSLVVSAAAGIVIGIVKKEFMAFFTAFAAAVCLSAPIFGRFIPSFITFITNKRLNREGTMIAGIDTADSVAQANAVVLDSADIFDRRSCTMHGMKDFKSMRIDVVLLYAAAMVIKSGGPLRECFEQVVDGRQDLLPPVRELVYEDKMGISARIYEQKVLLGNRNMLIHHNIKAPEKAFEDRYAHDGRKVIYLACNEQLAAMFVVSYSVDENIRNYLKQLENNGVQILVRTNDVNVTENLISESFGLNPDNFKILSSVAGRLYKRRKDTIIDRAPAGIIHDGSAYSMLKAMAAACSMAAKNKIGLFMQIAAMAVGIILTIVFGVSQSGLGVLAAVLIMLIECAGIAGTILFGKK